MVRESLFAVFIMYNTRQLFKGIIFSLCLYGLGIGSAEAASFSFSKVIDTNTTIEGSNLKFSPNSNDSPVFVGNALNNGNVAFVNIDDISRGVGIYTSINGSITQVADTNTAIPGGTGNFFAFNSPTFDNGSVAFRGFGATFFPNGSIQLSQEGIYSNLSGTLSVVADRNTPIPSSTGNFVSFDADPSLDNNVVAFTTNNGNDSGVYKQENGLLSVIANRSTVIPGTTSNFETLDEPVISNRDILFFGSRGFQENFRSGIYVASNNSLNVIADDNTPIPGGIGNFNFFDAANLDNNSVVLKGGRTTLQGRVQEGIYLENGGSLSLIADLNTPIPDGTGNFSSFIFTAPAIDDGNVAFIGYGSNSQAGLYTTLGGSLSKVIDINDTLDGKTFSPFSFTSATLGREGLSGNQLAFLAEFTDGSQGVYIATLNSTSIPESSTVLSIFAVAALGTLSKGTRSSKKV